MRKFLKDTRAEAYIGVMIAFLIFSLSFIVITFVLPVYHKQQMLDTMAKKLVRQAEIDGSVEQSSTEAELKSQLGIDPIITWDYTSYKGTKCVQLNNRIKVELEDEYALDLGDIFFPLVIPLQAIAYGKSEVYYK